MELYLKICMLLLDYNENLQKEKKVVFFVLPLLREVKTWLNQLTTILHFRIMLLKMKHRISLSIFCRSLAIQAVLLQSF